MFKKILSTAVLGVSVLGVMAANASVPGPYVTGQFGYAYTHMGDKTNIADIDKNLPGPAQIILDGDAKNLANNGFAGRLAVGYQFNQNFALELGYLQLNQKKANGETIVPSIPSLLKLNQNAIDLAAKGILPITSNFNLYGKLGVAYLTTNITAKSDDAVLPTHIELNNAAGIANRMWVPEAAVGISYDITPNISVDTSWTHIQPLGSNRPGNIDFVAVGLGYNFG